jgi:hypothetical protein
MNQISWLKLATKSHKAAKKNTKKTSCCSASGRTSFCPIAIGFSAYAS